MSTLELRLSEDSGHNGKWCLATGQHSFQEISWFETAEDAQAALTISEAPTKVQTSTASPTGKSAGILVAIASALPFYTLTYHKVYAETAGFMWDGMDRFELVFTGVLGLAGAIAIGIILSPYILNWKKDD